MRNVHTKFVENKGRNMRMYKEGRWLRCSHVFALSPTLSSPHLEVIQDSAASSDDAMRLQLRPLTDSKGQRVPDTYTLQVGKVWDGGER